MFVITSNENQFRFIISDFINLSGTGWIFGYISKAQRRQYNPTQHKWQIKNMTIKIYERKEQYKSGDAI